MRRFLRPEIGATARRGRPPRSSPPNPSISTIGLAPYPGTRRRWPPCASPGPGSRLEGEDRNMIARLFIDRPIFASVLPIVIPLAGGIALMNLPLAQYPHISPPTVQVNCSYPGASAQVVSESVATPIEQQVNGVEGMLYMS